GAVVDPIQDPRPVSSFTLLLLGSAAGAGAGLLAGLIGIGGGIVVVPVVFYGLTASGVPADAAAHIAVGTSLAAILPASIVSFLGHRRSGNTDIAFLVAWGPGIAVGVVAAQIAAPHLRGVILSAIFGLLCLVFAIPLRLSGSVPSASPVAAGGRVSTGWRGSCRCLLRLCRHWRRHPYQYRHDPDRIA